MTDDPHGPLEPPAERPGDAEAWCIVWATCWIWIWPVAILLGAIAKGEQ